MPPPPRPREPNRSSCRASPRRTSCRTLALIDEALLKRTVAFYLCTPSNPQGAVADRAYLARAIALARRFDFLLFADECYSEIYGETPPPGALETAYAETGSLANVVSFQSLSKRSGLPGLRSGFVAGDPEFIASFLRFRNVACPQVPLPVQHVSVEAWGDERHVERGRALYRENFAIADAVLAGRYGYRRPQGRLLSLAEYGRFRGRGSGGENPLERVWCQSAAGSLSRTSRTRWRQSGHGLHQGRARAQRGCYPRRLDAYRRYIGLRDGHQRKSEEPA